MEPSRGHVYPSPGAAVQCRCDRQVRRRHPTGQSPVVSSIIGRALASYAGLLRICLVNATYVIPVATPYNRCADRSFVSVVAS